MLEHLTQNQIEDYCRQKLSAAGILLVSDHMAACEVCRQRLETPFGGDAAFFALRSATLAEPVDLQAGRMHLTFEQTAEYVDGRLSGDELQVVKDHLTGCEPCALAVDDLRAFRNQVAPELDREYSPATAPATNESRRRRVESWLPVTWFKSPAVAFSAALAALLLMAAGWLWWQAQQKKETQPVIAVTTPSPTVTIPSTPESVTATAIAQLNDGPSRVILDQQGKLSGVDNMPPAYQRMVKEALTTQRVEKSSLLAGLNRPASSLMGSDEEGNQFSVTEPVGKVILSDRPTFRWSHLAGATGYVVEVYDEQFNLAAASSQLTDNSWKAPQPLTRGRVYSWQVKAMKDGRVFVSPRPPAPQAKFRILDRAQASELAQARRIYASSHLTLGLVYAQAGLLDEAEQELLALQKNNPNSAIVRRWLTNVRAMRR